MKTFVSNGDRLVVEQNECGKSESFSFFMHRFQPSCQHGQSPTLHAPADAQIISQKSAQRDFASLEFNEDSHHGEV